MSQEEKSEMDVAEIATRMLQSFSEKHPRAYQEWVERERSHQGLEGLSTNVGLFMSGHPDVPTFGVAAKVLLAMRREVRRRHGLGRN